MNTLENIALFLLIEDLSISQDIAFYRPIDLRRLDRADRTRHGRMCKIGCHYPRMTWVRFIFMHFLVANSLLRPYLVNQLYGDEYRYSYNLRKKFGKFVNVCRDN